MSLHKWYAPIFPSWFHPLMWFIIGFGLRLSNLTAKPPWTDEFSTLVFSLGNNFLGIPLDRAIATDILLQPLQPNPAASIGDVIHNLVTQDTHPPLYFALAYLWMKLFSDEGGLVSLFAARSLPAFIGAICILCVYILGRIAFRSPLVGNLAAAMMAVSPYAVFISQEARHYTLAALWVIGSLTCLVIATRHLQNRTALPMWVAFAWVEINALGFATHYFFSLTLCTEAVVLIFLAWHQKQTNTKFSLFSSSWQRIYAVAIGTFVASLIWLPLFLENRNRDNLTEWIRGSREGLDWIAPIFQALGTLITMISLLPVESAQLLVVIPSGLVMLIFFIWAVPILVRGMKIQLQHPENRIMIQVLAVVAISAIALFFIFTYFLDIDLTRGARYHFVYFPTLIVLLGASLAVCWDSPKQLMIKRISKWGINGKKAVILILLMSFVSAITVISNLGYQKYYRPDLFVQLIQQISSTPILIATTHKTHVHSGEMMGIAREIKLGNSPQNTQFLLAHQDQDPNSSSIALENTLKTLPRPFDLWLVNFHAPTAEAVKTCLISNTESLPNVDGYEYQLYHCQGG
ncbi:glycosyltransferase [Nostoc sp. ATCC 43529]|nr:glycosyltransferase [Nostoc sp. ATCC 43529]